MQNFDFLKKLIKDMLKVDQGLRMYPNTNEILPVNEQGLTLSNYSIYLADACHNYRIHRLIEDFGYPKQETVGPEVMKDFWLLVQHQDYDLKLQQNCLENCDFEPSQKAYLIDRTRMQQGLPQIYGTQYIMINGERKLYKVEDPDNLAVRKKEVGIED
ncbi:MAG: hypothetical protein P1P90_03425 [Patescibacteria group bacterium]|nr:hypothetical protein [Patescibacteria group bacterium]